MKLDAKSIVFGLILGCLLMVALGAVRAPTPSPRYQLALAPNTDPLVIDQWTANIYVPKRTGWECRMLGPPRPSKPVYPSAPPPLSPKDIEDLWEKPRRK